MALITLISTSELTLLVMMTITLNLNFVCIVEIRGEHWCMYQTVKMTIHKQIEGVCTRDY